MSLVDFIKEEGIEGRTTINDLEFLQTKFLEVMSDIWEFIYKKYMLLKKSEYDKDKFNDLDNRQKEVVDRAIAYYKIIFYIREQYYKKIKSSDDLIKQEIDLCRRDFVHFINVWAYAHEPRNLQLTGTSGEALPASIPLILYPAQRRVIEGIDFCYNNNLNFMVGKSREAGISWGFMAWGLSKWLFYDGFRLGVGSEKADKVDVLGSSNPLMGKARYILYNLPEFFRPASMKYDKNSYDNQFRIIHPTLGSEILGEVGENIGRSGRYSVFIIDEAQDLSAPQKADEGLESATRCRGDVGTARGMNHFGKKWKAGSSINHKIMWYEDPRKTKNWHTGQPDYDCWWRKYTEEANKDNPAKIAQEYDMDFMASVTDICIPPEWVQAAVEYPVENSGNADRVAGFDISGGGSDSSVVVVREGSRVLNVDSIDETMVTRAMWRAYSVAKEYEVHALNYDKISIGEAMYGLLVDSETDIPFHLEPIDGSSSAGDFIVPSMGEAASKIFYNTRAMIWWNLRERFRKTYENKTGSGSFPEDELISIPYNEKLIEQLSYPKLLDRNGRKLIESKKDMRSRGISSPDYADATAYAFFDSQSTSSKKAIRSFRLTGENGNFKSIGIQTSGRWDYLVALYIDKQSAVSAVISRFNPYTGAFHILEELSQNILSVEELIQNISVYVDPLSTDFENIRWVGNKELFTGLKDGKAHVVELFRRKGIRLFENYEEDDQLGLIVAEDMFGRDKITIDNRCKHLATQLSMVSIKNKKVDEQFGLVKSFLLTLTYMSERELKPTEPEFKRGYNRKKKDISELIKEAMFGIS